MAYYRRIKDLREDNDKTQSEVAQYLHVAQNTYSQYESGIRSVPVEIIVKLCHYYDVSSDYILELSDKKSPPI